MINSFEYHFEWHDSGRYAFTNLYNHWVYDNKYSYWTMYPVNDSLSEELIVVGDKSATSYGPSTNQGMAYPTNIYEANAGVLPVINVNKCSIGSCYYGYSINIEDECVVEEQKTNESGLVCKEGINYKTEKIYHYKKYNVGDVIEYNGEKYHVIEKSGTGKNYLTLLKNKPLTVDELYKYGRDGNGELFVNKYLVNVNDPEQVVYEYEDGIGGMAYYTSDTCGYEYIFNGSINIYNDIITLGCNYVYDTSDVKKVVDKWSNDVFENDLVEIDGYKARLITKEDLHNNLSFEDVLDYENVYYFSSTEQTPEWISNGNYNYWTMSNIDNDKKSIYVLNGYGQISIYDGNSGPFTDVGAFEVGQASVRPVVNIDKCAIDGGCEIEEIQVEDGCIEDKNNNNLKRDNISNNPIVSVFVGVGNTLKNIPLPILIICGTLIIGGISFFGYSFIKSKKELLKVRK